MSLSLKIDADLKKAMIARDGTQADTLRFLKSAIQYCEIEKKVETLSDADVQSVIQKQAKQHRESIEQFTKGGRAELAEKEKKELQILESYLPKQLSDGELEKMVLGEIQALGAATKKDFGRLMKIINEKLAGQAEARRISEHLGRHLK